jgi:hypothetical protein
MMSKSPLVAIARTLAVAWLVIASAPAPARAEEELATAMTELQKLTHKLSLATHHKNRTLSQFYLSEYKVMLEDIQDKIPEYEGIPVAVFIERFAKSPYHEMHIKIRDGNAEYSPDNLKPLMDGIIDSCNACHAASKVGHIKITNATNNPFNQDFSP